MLKGLVPDWKRYGAAFVDNNIGGNLPHLAKLLEAITPLRLRWGAAITFNAVADSLTEDDFDSEEERDSIMQPLQITDFEGRVLPQWSQSTKVSSKGLISANVRMLGR